MGHKRRRERTAREFNKLAHSQRRQFYKVEICQKLRTVFDVDCRYEFRMDGYDPKDRTRERDAKLKSKYRQYEMDEKEKLKLK